MVRLTVKTSLTKEEATALFNTAYDLMMAENETDKKHDFFDLWSDFLKMVNLAE